MIIPSLLEYSSESLQKKLTKAKNKPRQFIQLSKQSRSGFDFCFHLDFVLDNFAKDRSVMRSLAPEVVLGFLAKLFLNKKIELTIHLMGDTQDLFEARQFFNNYEFIKNWTYKIFVPKKFTNEFCKIEKKNIKIGIWWDLGQWDEAEIKDSQRIIEHLLMTVYAGKSGQKLTIETKQASLDLATKFTKNKFIVDGGWAVNDILTTNIRAVSYTSFWGNFK